MDKENTQKERIEEGITSATEEDNTEIEQVCKEEATEEESVVKRAKTPIEGLYDHIPLTYKQVDMITKFSIVILIIILAIAVIGAILR